MLDEALEQFHYLQCFQFISITLQVVKDFMAIVRINISFLSKNIDSFLHPLPSHWQRNHMFHIFDKKGIRKIEQRQLWPQDYV